MSDRFWGMSWRICPECEHGRHIDSARVSCGKCGAEWQIHLQKNNCNAILDVLTLKEQHIATFRAKPEDYWLTRLMEEVGELASALCGRGDDSPDLELRQIASMCLNWLEMRGESET